MTKNSTDGRRSARSNVLLSGTLESPGFRARVRIANMSAHGVLVVGDAVPAEGSKLAFKCNGVEIQGWVAWIRPPCAGIDFRDPIRTELLLRTCPVSNQLITKDTRTIDFKRPGFRGNQLTEEERRIVEEWSALTRMSSRAQ